MFQVVCGTGSCCNFNSEEQNATQGQILFETEEQYQIFVQAAKVGSIKQSNAVFKAADQREENHFTELGNDGELERRRTHRSFQLQVENHMPWWLNLDRRSKKADRSRE